MVLITYKIVHAMFNPYHMLCSVFISKVNIADPAVILWLIGLVILIR